MTAKPTISVVIPAYNEQELIAQCLASLAAQTRPADEIIVVDNNSTDHTAQVAPRFPGVSVVTEHRQGIVFARNAGFNAARSDIIARCDADCTLPPDWLARIQADFAAHPGIVGVTGSAVSRVGPRWLNRLGRRLHIWTYFALSRLFTGHRTLFGSNQAITRAAWEQVRDHVHTDERHMHEDIDLAIHLAPFGPIYFDRRLDVAVSPRIFTEGPKKLASRLKRWPETAWIHRRGAPQPQSPPQT